MAHCPSVASPPAPCWLVAPPVRYCASLVFGPQYQTVQIARRQITEVFALPLEHDQPSDAPALRQDTGAAAKPVSIEMSGVAFRYDSNKSELLFNDLDLDIKPGEIIGITGSNGAGKSAFLHLISGILKPEKGVIKVDGKDIRNDDPAILRSQICYLPQSGTLFEGTILENLTMFQVEDRLAKAFEIATRLGLTDVIARLPEGYDTKVSNGPEDGLPVSIKQRLAIARSAGAGRSSAHHPVRRSKRAARPAK